MLTSTLHNYKICDGLFVKHSSRLKPKLNEQHKTTRLLFAFDHVENSRFADIMFDEVHLDEKWFYILYDRQGVYCVPQELMDTEEFKNSTGPSNTKAILRR